MSTLGWCFLFKLVIFYNGVYSNTIQLMPTQLYAIENSSATLTCSKTNGILAESVWINSQITQDANLYYLNGKCITTRFLKDSDLFGGVCNSNGTYSVVLKKINRTQHGAEWICREISPSNTVVLNVSVPATSVKLSQANDYIKENTNTIISCKTSECRPEPRVQWYLHNSTGQDVKNLTQSSTKRYINGEYGLKSVESILQFSPNRTANNLRLHCEVRTRTDEVDIKSREIIVNVTYPPDNSPVIHRFNAGNIVQVIESEKGAFVCSISGGNPLAALNWNCFGSHDLTSSTQDSTVTSTVKWTALRSYDTCSCTSNHVLSNWKRTTNLTVNVQYPPSLPTIHISNYNGESVKVLNEYVSITETETINVTCFSKSKPLPTYKWITQQSFKQQSTNILEFVNISRQEKGTYVCNVENNMTRSTGKIEEGKSNSKMILNILYPAIVNDIYDMSVVEGSQFEKSCPVVYGNPSNSTVTWYRLSDENRWNNIQLYIKNVSREDDANYTCSVITEMYPTLGSSSEIERRKSFHLNVFYPSEISKFTISTVSSGRTFVVNKTQNLPFECIALANPTSDLNIKSPRGDYIVEVSQSNIARHTLRNASFNDAGEYICTGRNNYTRDTPSQSKLTLIVKSRPRPSSGDTSDMQVATVLNVDVTLPFKAWNYLDEPNKTMFKWFKENVSIPDNDNKYIVHSNDLQTNITITNTTQQDLGLYKVNVENSVGMYTHHYILRATDKPERPRDFRVMNDSVTDTSVTLAWSPGFNGGFQQTFVIIYKMIQERVWLNKSIKDYGGFNKNYTLNDLSRLQEYEIEMFAKNIEGNSSHTERLYFKTKAPLTSQVKSQPDDKSGIIAGSLSVVVIVVIVTVVVIFIYRKRRNKSTDSLYQNVPFFEQKGNRTKNVTNEAKMKRRNCPTNETTFEEKSNRRKPSINGEVRKGNNSETDEHAVEGLQEVDDVPIIVNERTEYCNSPDKIDRITVAELHAYVSGNDDSLEAEYQKLPTGLQKSCTFARKPENLALNRYNGIYPYDHSRVKIPEHPDFFLNACYINGYRKKKAYIASLGPTSKTTSDFKTFWQMVWHERSDMIIMLTKLHEPSGMKCEKYWPNKGTDQQYGDVTVTCETFEAFAEYTIRTFRVSKGNQHRSLTHLHYTAWPDKTVPEDVTSLLDFRNKMKDVPITQGGPNIIHCSAGIGRTGTLIALDILIEEGQDKDSVNVFECVDNLRTQRVKMVQTVEQYIYIHKCLVNALSYDGETIVKERIHEQVYNRNDKQYITLFKQLKASVETDNTSEQKTRLKNRNNSNKNRQEADVPGDRFIVFLNLTDGKEGSEYINAVYVNSFKRKDHFIVAQSPLPNTITDFVSMIFQEDCSCIATMEDLKEPGMTVGTYLPEMNQKAIFGNFQVSSSQLEETSAYIIRKMKIKYTNKNADGEKCFYHFHYKNWMTGSKTPGNVSDFVNFISEVEEYANELGEDRSRVVVHCLKANERSCLFCAVAIIIEKLKVEGKVNILNVIRHLRTRRRTAIVSKEQLKFCYEAASAYIKQNKH